VVLVLDRRTAYLCLCGGKFHFKCAEGTVEDWICDVCGAKAVVKNLNEDDLTLSFHLGSSDGTRSDETSSKKELIAQEVQHE
jgi:hypothetical protein